VQDAVKQLNQGDSNADVRKAQAGALSGWEINEMPANKRLRRHLARALA
jgi:hypothetical protein